MKHKLSMSIALVTALAGSAFSQALESQTQRIQRLTLTYLCVLSDLCAKMPSLVLLAGIQCEHDGGCERSATLIRACKAV